MEMPNSYYCCMKQQQQVYIKSNMSLIVKVSFCEEIKF